MTRTADELKKEAIIKYDRISDKKKSEHLKKRKESIIKTHIISMVLLLVLGVLCIIFAITKEEIGRAVLGIVLEFFAVIAFGTMFVRLGMPERNLIIEQLVVVLKKTYATWSYEKEAQAKAYVQRHSGMIQNIQELNKQYQFDRSICKRHSFREKLDSKRQFDNFDFRKWIFNKMESLTSLFERMESVYDENSKKYSEYSAKYDSLKCFTQEIEIEDLNVEYELFNYVENSMFEGLKYSKIEAPNVFLAISYTSPSGRNHYSGNYNYTYRELLSLVQEKKVEEERLLAEKLKKDALNKEKREKERKLRELDKKEKQLNQKEKELDEKQKEFFEATKEHVYTTGKDKIVKETPTEIEDGMSLSQKMKILREKFDNGEITYEDYQKARKELL